MTVSFAPSHFADPRTTPSMPSVMMNGIIRRPAIAAPFRNPITAPAAMIASTTAAVGQPCWISSAPTTLVNAMLEPTLRSIPPLTMISVMPSAPIATITVCVRMILKFA